MGYQLQIAIPLFATFAALATIAILRKYIKVETFVIGLAVLGLAIFMTVQHTSAGVSVARVKAEEGSSAKMRDISLNLANQYMLDGEYGAAVDVLENLMQSDSADKNVQLAMARCAALQANYTAAVSLYRQASDASDELERVTALLSASTANSNATIALLEEQGRNPDDYGLQKVTVERGDRESTVKLIRNHIKENMDAFESKYGEDVRNVIKRASTLTVAFSSFVSSNSDADLEEVANALEKLEAYLEDESALNDNVHLRMARLKGYVITGDYDKIAQMLNRIIVADELVILSQLLVSDLIDEEDFSEAYINVDTGKYENVLKICQRVLERNKDSLSKDRYQAYMQKLNRMQQQLQNPVLFTLQQDLLVQATEGDPKMQSKCYLALAKLENRFGTKEQADIYISDALGTASNSDDENYSIPMNQMTDIIQGNSESSEIKNVAEYVDSALDHSLPLDVTVSDISTETGGLDDQMTDTVIKTTATINIGVIETKDSFPVVKARVQVQSGKWTTFEEIQEHLNVLDCGSEITEFTLEKLEFQGSKIILLCDCSGSMSGSVEQLKQVVRDFAACMEEGEEICVVGFESDISFVKEVSGDIDEVIGYADSLYAGGGTALFDALLYAGELHTQDINANNIIIAMTDGQDGSPAKEGDMYNKIGAMAAEKGLTVYTVGLGDVDTDYLQFMAQCGNGSFLYANSEEDLQTFYDFIHGQLNNQYILTYTAKNQTRNERTLELSLDDELGSKKKTYYLKAPEYTNEGADAYNPYVVEDTDITVVGLSEKFLYKSSQSYQLKLKGSGFDAGDDITVRLVGSVKYTLETTFVDSDTYTITIPAAVATGVYDLEVSIAGSSVTLKSELTVAVAGNMKVFNYGDYSFTALNSYVNDAGDTVLTGRVVMNGWLQFKGDVTVRYDYADSGKAWITDHSGFYVSYTSEMATGLAQFVADKGIPISFGALGTFAIYPDAYTPGQYKDFPVDDAEYDNLINLFFLVCDDFSVAIYPDMLRLQGMNFTFKLPFQEQLMRNFDSIPQRSVDFDSDCLIGATEVALFGTLEYKDFGEDKAFVMVSLPLTIDEFKVDVDTLNNDYRLEAKVGLASMETEEALKFSFGVVGGKFDSIGLGLESDDLVLPLVETPVPISMKNFGFELSGFSKYEEVENGLDLLSNILGTTVTAEFEVHAANLRDKFPKIADLIGKKDAALASMTDCKLSLTLKELRLSFDAKLVFASVLDVGKVHVSAGKFNYTNALIGYYNKEQIGLQIALTVNVINWDTPNVEMAADGTIELCLGYPYSGLWLNGKADFEVDVWFFDFDFDVRGDAMIGAYQNSYGNLQFSVILRGQNSKGEYSGFHAYVTQNTGFDVYLY